MKVKVNYLITKDCPATRGLKRKQHVLKGAFTLEKCSILLLSFLNMAMPLA